MPIRKLDVFCKVKEDEGFNRLVSAQIDQAEPAEHEEESDEPEACIGQLDKLLYPGSYL